MSGKKWLGLFLAALALVLAVQMGVNIAVDPFNVFGDRLLRWTAYTHTLNPRISKATYVSERFDEIDSYVIGSSTAAAYLPEVLEGCTGETWYNMFHYGPDTVYDRQIVSYLLSHDDTIRQMLLVVGVTEAAVIDSNSGSLADRGPWQATGESPWTFYRDFLFANPKYAREKLGSLRQDTRLPQGFDTFVPETGAYDKRLRDVEPIGALSGYLEERGEEFVPHQEVKTLCRIDECVANIAAIREMCGAAGVELTVLFSPICKEQLEGYSSQTLGEYQTKLAQVTGFWDFGVSPLSYDQRYFYDGTHARNATASMVLSRVFGDESGWRPEDFGTWRPAGSVISEEAVDAHKRQALAKMEAQAQVTAPILLYHHLSRTEEESGTVLSPETFAHQMDLLAREGYHPVTFAQLVDFVRVGTPLPDKPVLITFDDGYLSNYEYAFPVLREHGFPATIFVIGSAVGHYEYYKDTQYRLTPHFGGAEIEEMTASGLVDIQSHTYDMHQWPPFEGGDRARANILPLEGESEGDYIDALARDAARQDDLFARYGLEKSAALAFPAGQHVITADAVLNACGYRVTVTTDGARVNTPVRGLPQSLIDLGRLNVDGETTDGDILRYLSLGR